MSIPREMKIMNCRNLLLNINGWTAAEQVTSWSLEGRTSLQVNGWIKARSGCCSLSIH